MTSPETRALHEQNGRSWNLATKAHNSHKGDQARFFREGGSTLFPEELELLGDVAGKRLVHLQCNLGQDTLSLAKLGAIATGVDISDEAIAFARKLSQDAAIPATFERADVYDWFNEAAAAGRQFDIAFCSYGAVCWLGHIDAWGRGIASVLAPGRFAMIDIHPVQGMFNERWEIDWPYSTSGKPLSDGGIGDYVAAAGEALVPWGYE